MSSSASNGKHQTELLDLRESARTEARGSVLLDGLRTAPFLISAALFLVVGPWVSAVLADAGAASVDARPGATDAATPGGLLEVVLFYLVGGMTVLSALGICVSKNIVRMAVWLFVALGSVAMLYFLLAAAFLGAIQLIVYAGGTLLLLVFGVMLTSKSPWVRFEPGKLELVGAAAVCGTLLCCLCVVLGGAVWRGTKAIVPGATVADIGERLLTTYLVPFEVAGVLLMIVMVGAAHLARQEK